MDQRRARRPGPRSGRVGSDSRSSSSEDKTEAVPSLLSDDDAGLTRRRAVRVGTSKMFSNLNFVPAECGSRPAGPESRRLGVGLAIGTSKTVPTHRSSNLGRCAHLFEVTWILFASGATRERVYKMKRSNNAPFRYGCSGSLGQDCESCVNTVNLEREA